jgi:protoporphyrinogen oxidase
LLPLEVLNTLRKLGDDGEKVRGALERDFAEYAKKSQKDRQAIGSVLLLALGRPLASRVAKAIGDMVFSPDPQDVSARLAQIRERAGEGADRSRAAARDRIASARRDGADPGTPQSPADETAPTGI